MQLGSEPTAAGGGVKGGERVAAVKISRVYSEQEILGTATGRHSGLNVHKSSRFPATAGHRYTTPAGVMELVDVVDSKSTAGDSVPVRVRSPAPKYGIPEPGIPYFLCRQDTILPYKTPGAV